MDHISSYYWFSIEKYYIIVEPITFQQFHGYKKDKLIGVFRPLISVNGYKKASLLGFSNTKINANNAKQSVESWLCDGLYEEFPHTCVLCMYVPCTTTKIYSIT